jgi:hypothetical protein
MTIHRVFTDLFRTVFTPSCDACGSPILDDDHDNILCPSCRESLRARSARTIRDAVDSVSRVPSD